MAAQLMLVLAPGEFTVLKPRALADVDWSVRPVFMASTQDEISVVCPSYAAPAACEAKEEGWRLLRVKGPLDFSLVGILARLTGALAARNIPVFAVSTFDTDYLLVKRERLDDALRALREDAQAIVTE